MLQYNELWAQLYVFPNTDALPIYQSCLVVINSQIDLYFQNLKITEEE